MYVNVNVFFFVTYSYQASVLCLPPPVQAVCVIACPVPGPVESLTLCSCVSSRWPLGGAVTSLTENLT